MNLKTLRKCEGKTQTDIAKFLQVAQQTYCGYELETSEPNLETLIKLADYYGVTLDYLVGREFKNEVGYLTDNEKKLLQNYRSLNEENKRILVAESNGMLLAQL